MTSPTSHQAQDLLAKILPEDRETLFGNGVHCIRRVAYCETRRSDYAGKLDATTFAWARGADLSRPVLRPVMSAFRELGIVGWDGGSVLTDLGREVARLITEGAT